MENIGPNFQEAFDFAISKGTSICGSKYFAADYCEYWYDELKAYYDEDPDEFNKEHHNCSFYEIALESDKESIENVDMSKSWGHSDEWAIYYALHGNDGKGESYTYLKSIAPEKVYQEAYTEYISRGFTAKFSSMIANEIQNCEWTSNVEELEANFIEYERLYNEAKTKNKSDDFADFYAEFTISNEYYECYSWTFALLREKLQSDNKSADYIDDVIWFLNKEYDDIEEETLAENSEDHWKIIEAFGFADGREYALKNNLPNPYEFGRRMTSHYNNCREYNHMHPYKELALFWSIKEHNNTAEVKIPISQSELDLVKKVEDQIHKDNMDYYKSR